MSLLFNAAPDSLLNGQKKFLQQVFTHADVSHQGFLCQADLKVAMVAALGYKASKHEVQRVMSSCDDLVDCNGDPLPGVCLKHFIAAMEARSRVRDSAECIRQVFLAFDRKCQGFLTLDDLKHAAASVAPRLPEDSLEIAFRELDRDGDGRISFGDFDFMMRYRT
ncbi:EF-hand calcium-binding domain-containing protein 11-like [Sycon ciliatum]|uniref:EF-hand calcium-binding domain-containing protein 11-like n=1 Tax=Sycon ciliatum TaxID=27933 RepID=UPI0020AD35F4|eukprot:scpid71252/ scgid13817/ EF-hand calcium-binding domain-containing protein 11